MPVAERRYQVSVTLYEKYHFQGLNSLTLINLQVKLVSREYQL